MSEPESSSFTDPGGVTVHLYRWVPAGPPRALVHLAHGMGEHARRYDRVAAALTAAGYEVWADDHRASGRTGAEGAGLGDLGPGGMQGAVESLHAAVAHVAATRPDLAVHLVGHSWGSFLAQRIAERWGGDLAGLVLSGSTLLAGEYLTLGDPNERFQPAATPYDWLSRDPAEVRAYLDDPWCGFEVAFDVAELVHLAIPPADSIPPGLPILVVNGSEDSVGGFNGGGAALADAYRELGVVDVTYREYPGARHELFNETNRDEVLADLVAWLDAHTAG
ncbi:alpha/beta fold hydrolase [Acidimicrobiaceae bacterium USS-CC1]|uniref:Alpha/beta fold hydrolase n=1 Tax=Acidiferrimicrobium australe TaxID=2664430 RepID=A0ABW9QUQ6_9ACTN|nr:alpha/beta fold hydrolase [Acidiferrimicrobium australe]